MRVSIFRKPSTDNLAFHPGSTKRLQPGLEINRPGDRYEQEADAMANRVMNTPGSATAPVTQGSMIARSIQRKCAHCEEEEKTKKMLMRKSDTGGWQAPSSLALSLNHSAGGGSPLPQSTRGFMENAFSADFSSVRVHADNHASEMARSVRARAFTYGNDIYFRQGAYEPESRTGKSLLAHELTHVIQQSNGQQEAATIQRQGDDTAQPMDAARCYSCQIPGGLGICCPSTDMPYVPECWDLGTRIVDNCPGPRESCEHEARCAQCQCVAAKKGEQYCPCTGMI